MRVILDIGSTHNNDLSYLRRVIDFAYDHRNTVELKVQLFDASHVAARTNIVLDHDVFLRALDYARNKSVRLFASVFDLISYDYYRKLVLDTIKFAHSMRNSDLVARAIDDGYKEVIVSHDYLDNLDSRCTNLLCIPQYPVLSVLDIQDKWFERFSGLSDHTLGIIQTLDAIHHGAKIIEKHIAFRGHAQCPDALIGIDELEADWLARS